MNDFKGTSRDTVISKTPSDMWYFARNILLTGKYLSVSNEKGNEYGYEIPGVVIGFIITNEDIVYMSVDGNYSCLGYVNSLDEVYKPVIRTTNPNFKFNLNSPIEGVYVYNYKRELIVAFSDGVNKNSGTPKLVNLHNPQITLSSTYEFITPNDYVMFEMFNSISLPTCSFSYESGGFDAEVVYVAFSYVFADNTDTLLSPILETTYPNFKGYNVKNRNVKFTLTNLSNNFTKVRLAFIVKKDASTSAFYSPILTIENGIVQYTLSTTENLTESTVEEIVISTERFTKIKTITKTANQIIVGNVQQKEIDNFQKYANRLELSLSLLNSSDMEQYKSHPTFLPDEVYSIRVVPIYLDGTKGQAYHIPGRKPINNETQLLTVSDFGSLGLNFVEMQNKGYKRFHLINSGIINDNNSCTFGYWENEELYPNKSYYNSSDIGGEDLRGTPIRHFKLPSLASLSNSQAYWKTLKPKAKGTIDEDLGYMPRFEIKVTNFNEVFPKEIRDKLQGYELIFDKRYKGATYIETNGFLYKTVLPKGISVTGDLDQDSNHETEVNPQDKYVDFSTCNFVSVEVARDKIEILSTIVKIYYAVRHEGFIKENTGTAGYPTILPTIAGTNERMAVIKDFKYLLANNITSNNRFGEEKLQLELKHLSTGDTSEEFIPILDGQGNKDLNILYSSLITLNKNIYNLENNNDFISIGIFLLDKVNDKLVNGDVFCTNIIRKLFSPRWKQEQVQHSNSTIYSYLNYYLYNMYSPISNSYIINGSAKPPPFYYQYQMQLNSLPGFGPFIRDILKLYYADWKPEDINVMGAFDFSTVVRQKPISGYFNDYVEALPPALTENYVNYFPYRVYKGLAIPDESLQTKNLRFFPTNQYYDMRNDRGEIIALRGYNRGLYIQQKYSLFETTIADSLEVKDEQTFLGSSELFDRIPEEILYNDNIGYIGSNSQFACFVFRDGYVTVDEERGKIFLVNKSLSDISQRNMKTYFVNALPLGNAYMKEDLLGNKVKIDNPFASIGYLVGFDEENNRLLITKKYYSPKASMIESMTFDGEFYYDGSRRIIDFNNKSYFNNESKTYSFSLDSQTWVCEHDYFPNGYIYNNKGIFTIKNTLGGNTKHYKHNSNNVNPGNFYGEQFEAYVDLCFNSRIDLSKQYQSVAWTSDSVDMLTGRTFQFKTINAMVLISDFQCSGRIEINPTNLTVARNTEGKWQLNEFRDMTRSTDMRILDDDGNLNMSNLTTTKAWYDKGMFIGNYIITRMIWDNKEKVITYVNNVNVKSIISKR